jgi:hypothetical protein
VISKILTLICALTIISAVQPVFAQVVDTLIWQVITHDENEFYGTIIEESEDKIKIKTKELGVITINKEDIESRKLIKSTQYIDGKFWPENIYASRYFWAPNGYGLKKGEGYYENIWVVINQVSYGITDHFSIGLGTIPLFLLGGFDITPFWITPKFSIPIKEDKLNAGIGLIYFFVPEFDGNLGIAYGNMTLGSRDKNATLGLGYGLLDGELSRYPTVNFSGILRGGKRSYFITENYFIGSGDNYALIIMLGGRWAGKNVSIDYGLFRTVASDSDPDPFIAYPWLGIHVPFGKSKI